jgi:hypothetical protein
MSDKDLFFQLLEREIDNMVRGFGPWGSLVSQPVKNAVFKFIDPYIDAFFVGESTKINSRAASAFLKSEINQKIEKFVKDFETEREQNDLQGW